MGFVQVESKKFFIATLHDFSIAFAVPIQKCNLSITMRSGTHVPVSQNHRKSII